MNGLNQNSQMSPKGVYIRTMQEDIENLEKGISPAPSAKEIEVPSNIPVAPEVSVDTSSEIPPMPSYESPKSAEIQMKWLKYPQLRFPKRKN